MEIDAEGIKPLDVESAHPDQDSLINVAVNYVDLLGNLSVSEAVARGLISVEQGVAVSTGFTLLEEIKSGRRKY